jgi:hypothetical protein
MGKGSHVNYKEWNITSADESATSFYVDINNNNASITTNSELVYSHPSSITNITENTINTTLSIADNNFSNSEKTLICYQDQQTKNWNFKINNIEITDNTNLKIVNLLGQTVYKQAINSTTTEANLESIADGLYLALITDNNAIIASKKIVVNK